MTSAQIIDIATWEKLLAPLSLNQPTGEFLKYDEVYDQIQTARIQEDERLPQGVWQREIKKADWGRVEKLCMDVLISRSKDLQIAAWLTEAWFMRYQLPGFLTGLKLLNALCERFWADLYPPIEADDMEYRLAPFNWMNEKLGERLSSTVVGISTSSPPVTLSFADWLAANTTMSKAGGAVEDTDAMTLVRFKKIQALTPSSFYQDLVQLLDYALDEVIRIEAFVSARDASHQGILNLLRRDIQKIRDFCKFTLTERGELSDTPLVLTNPLPDTQNAKGTQTVNEISKDAAFISKTIASREEAYRMLAEAADVLARIEPHSPTPYLVRRAIAWGHMSLVELMQEMVHDRSNLAQIMQLLGVNSTPPQQGQ